jgi:hypothetical protein
VSVATDSALLRTAPFTLDPGQERYLCYATTLDQDIVVDSYTHEAQPFVHHVVFVRTNAPEPDGFSECNVLFRTSWDPLFITGAGRSEITFPAGVGHKLAANTQLLVQLHLLNTSEDHVESAVEVTMRRSHVDDPKPVGTYVFGTTSLNLPAAQTSEAQALCTLREPVQLIAGFAHMHWLGRSLSFEVGSSENQMHTLFARDPYNFDDQHLELIDVTLNPGDMTRVTCHYDNTHDHSVGFGESTTTEMCFFVGLAVGRDGLSSCITRSAAR